MAVVSKVDIGNLALSNIGISSTIESFTEASIEAKQINAWYDFARKQMLEASDWTFARKLLTLALAGDAAAPDVDWAYRYQYPVDCIKMRRIVNPVGLDNDVVPYRIANSDDGSVRTILTNLEDAQAEYTFDLTETSLFSFSFIQALSYLLGHYVAYALTGNNEMRIEMLKLAAALQRKAAAEDMNEGNPSPPRDADWIRDR